MWTFPSVYVHYLVSVIRRPVQVRVLLSWGQGVKLHTREYSRQILYPSNNKLYNTLTMSVGCQLLMLSAVTHKCRWCLFSPLMWVFMHVFFCVKVLQ